MYELAKHLQMIIAKETSLVVTNKPPLVAPARVSLPVLGMQSSQDAFLDEIFLSNESDIRQNAEQTRKERENRGKGSMHSQLLSFSCPDLNDLIDRRICSVQCCVGGFNRELEMVPR